MIYDISQELFSCHVFPGDPAPAYEALGDMQRGDLYNLTAFSMCAHNGTHVDAPLHFVKGGRTVDEIPLTGAGKNDYHALEEKFSTYDYTADTY